MTRQPFVDTDTSAQPGLADPPPSLAHTIVSVVPWAVTIGHAIWLGSLALLDGALALALLMVPWVSLVAISRRQQARFRTKLGRIGLDLVVLTACVLGVSLGGLWMLPGVSAFLALDVIEPGRLGSRARAIVLLAVTVFLAALPGLLFAFIVWPAALVAVVSLLVPLAVPTGPTEEAA